jgi:hypothetical protein
MRDAAQNGLIMSVCASTCATELFLDILVMGAARARAWVLGGVFGWGSPDRGALCLYAAQELEKNKDLEVISLRL